MSAQSLSQTTSRRLPTTYHSVHPGFHARKQQILTSLTDSTIARTDNNINKYSSKVSSPLIDETIFPILELINKHDDYIVTSSCSGKISIISTCANSNKCKNSKKPISSKLESLMTTGNINQDEIENGVVYRHQDYLVELPKEKGLINNFLLKMIFGEEFENVISSNNESYNLLQNNDYNLIYFKFEPMILHAEARTLDAAKNLVNLAVEVGYHNSGMLTTSKRHMVAIRNSMKLETPIAYLNLSTQKIHLLVDLSYLHLLINLSNQHFEETLRKINDLLSTLDNNLFGSMGSGDDGIKRLKDGGKTWEHKEERRERKRRDGLARQIGLRKSGTLSDGNDGDVSTVDDENQGLDNLDNV
ncbi:4452_t:CDS:2 [Scutellospora calospora]|uniref:4452_t:CDS:1 n=1 Tax=Scutellospora calospora TaxID=85575 RepID=A0ACA9KXX7_9GLOM|nr:4452_t:CDS:2 [Scutellospora calospora]